MAYEKQTWDTGTVIPESKLLHVEDGIFDVTETADQNTEDIKQNADDIAELNSALAQNVTTTGTDLNNYTTRGLYYFSGGYTPTNIPAGSNGWLEVFTDLTSGGTVKQLWFRQGTPGTNDYQTYVRTYSSNTWGDWVKYITQEDLESKSNALSVATVAEDNVTVPSDSYATGSVSASKSGYKPLGIVGVNIANGSSGGVNNSRCYINRFYLGSSGNINYQVCNRNTSDAAVIIITFYVLYVAN